VRRPGRVLRCRPCRRGPRALVMRSEPGIWQDGAAGHVAEQATTSTIVRGAGVRAHLALVDLHWRSLGSRRPRQRVGAASCFPADLNPPVAKIIRDLEVDRRELEPADGVDHASEPGRQPPACPPVIVCSASANPVVYVELPGARALVRPPLLDPRRRRRRRHPNRSQRRSRRQTSAQARPPPGSPKATSPTAARTA
jgi:hypothetical protein